METGLWAIFVNFLGQKPFWLNESLKKKHGLIHSFDQTKPKNNNIIPSPYHNLKIKRKDFSKKLKLGF